MTLPKNLKKKRVVPLDLLKEYLRYDPLTGHWLRLRRYKNSKSKVGDRADKIGSEGRPYVNALGSSYLASRLAWLYMTGEWPMFNIDHRDNVSCNNKWKNLRACNQQQNLGNSRIRKNNKSGIKGVHRTKHGWRAMIAIDYRSIHIGRYKTKAEAAEAYARAAKSAFGEFARTEKNHGIEQDDPAEKVVGQGSE